MGTPREIVRIELYSLNDETTTPITRGCEDFAPAWNSAGTSVAFVRRYAGSEGLGQRLYIASQSSAQPEAAVTTARKVQRPQWCPSSAAIAYLGSRAVGARSGQSNETCTSSICAVAKISVSPQASGLPGIHGPWMGGA